MTETPRKFQVVEDTPDSTDNPTAAIAANALMLGLSALSQRAIAGGKALFTVLSVGSAWWLWSATPKPDQYQIASLTIYAGFILAMNWIVWRK